MAKVTCSTEGCNRLAHCRGWCEKHYDAARYAANIEQARASRRAYAAAHREEARARKALWNIAHPGRQSVLYKNWALTNPDRARANYQKGSRKRSANRRARKAAAFVELVDPGVVFARDGGVCQICGESIDDAKWHIDHRVPIARGGEHSYANTQLAHAICNLSKGARLT